MYVLSICCFVYLFSCVFIVLNIYFPEYLLHSFYVLHLSHMVLLYIFVLFSHRNGWLYFAAFSAVLGSFIFGYALVFPSAVIPQVQQDDDPSLHMDVHQISWFGVRAGYLFLTEYHIILNCLENESTCNVNQGMWLIKSLIFSQCFSPDLRSMLNQNEILIHVCVLTQ